MSRHVPREVAAQIPVDKLEVFRQDDGMWRWRWVPAEAGSAEPLVAGHAFSSAEEAEESARAAYPTTTRVVVERPPRGVAGVAGEAGRTARHGCAAALATLAVGVLVVVRRRRTPG